MHKHTYTHTPQVNGVKNKTPCSFPNCKNTNMLQMSPNYRKQYSQRWTGSCWLLLLFRRVKGSLFHPSRDASVANMKQMALSPLPFSFGALRLVEFLALTVVGFIHHAWQCLCSGSLSPSIAIHRYELSKDTCFYIRSWWWACVETALNRFFTTFQSLVLLGTSVLQEWIYDCRWALYSRGEIYFLLCPLVQWNHILCCLR